MNYNKGRFLASRSTPRKHLKTRSSYLLVICSAFFLLSYVVGTWLVYTALALHPGSYEISQWVQAHNRSRSTVPLAPFGVDSVGTGLSDTPEDLVHIGVFLPLLGLKPSTGPKLAYRTEQRQLIERVAIQGWHLAAEVLTPGIAIHVHGLVESAGHCNPRWNDQLAGSHFNCLVLPKRCLHSHYDDAPTIDCVLETMTQVADAQLYNYVMLANGDLLFKPRAFAASMHSVLLRWPRKGLVLVGQRTDTSWQKLSSRVDETAALDFQAYETLHEASMSSDHGAVRHPDFGVDYFLMSTHLIPKSFPPFLVGRFRWDNALLAKFLVDGDSRDVAVVDATSALPVLHLGSTYSSDPEYHYSRLGADYNDALANEHFGELYKLGRIRNTAWRLDSGSAQDVANQCFLERRPLHERPDHFSLLAIARANDGPLLLVAVLPHELMHALEWLRNAKQRWSTSWFCAHYLFVALDADTYNALEAAAPGQTILEEMTGWPRSPAALNWKSFEQLLRLRMMPIAILSAATLQGISQDRLDRYATAAASCVVVMLRGRGELFSAQFQNATGIAFWRRYKVQDGKHVDPGEGVCWV